MATTEVGAKTERAATKFFRQLQPRPGLAAVTNATGGRRTRRYAVAS